MPWPTAGTKPAAAFFQDGTTFGKLESRLKEWWVQMKGLNSLLLMHEKYGQQTDVYFKAFQRQRQFIRTYQIDGEFSRCLRDGGARWQSGEPE
jgi:hypothetical protein